MSDSLTREQVEAVINKMISKVRGNSAAYTGFEEVELLNHDAALRQRVEELEQCIKDYEAQDGPTYKELCNANVKRVLDLEQQLATSQAKVEELNEALEESTESLALYKQELFSAKELLAMAQLAVSDRKQLEQQLVMVQKELQSYVGMEGRCSGGHNRRFRYDAVEGVLSEPGCLACDLATVTQERDDARKEHALTLRASDNTLKELAAAQAQLARFYELGLDCGGHSCFYAKDKSGMRHNGPCHCKENFKQLEAQVERLREALEKAYKLIPSYVIPMNLINIVDCRAKREFNAQWIVELIYELQAATKALEETNG